MGIQDRDYFHDKHDELSGRKAAQKAKPGKVFSQREYDAELRRSLREASFRRRGEPVPTWAPWIMGACLLLLVVVVILAWELRAR